MTSGSRHDRQARRTIRHLSAVLAVCGVLSLAPLAGQAAPLRVDDSQEVVGHVEQVRDDLGVPHVLLVVSDGAEPLLERSFGDGGGPGPQDQVLIGSIAKSMTATLVVQQVDRGRFRLDSPVESVLPWLDLPEVTVEQLLTHTSGFTAADGLAVSERGAIGPDSVRRAAQDLRRSEAAGEYRYSSANYLVLGAMLEEVTGRRFADVLRTDLLEPLGMDSTTALAGEAELVDGHRWWFGRAFALAGTLDESGAPFGYVASTPADLQTYAAAHAGARPDVLDEDLLARLHEPRVTSDDDAYGFGWRVRGHGRERLVHHTGATPGYFAHVVVRPSDGRSVVVVADAYGEAQALPLASLGTDVLSLLDGADVDPTPTDRLLTTAPWVLTGTAIAGLVLVLVAAHRPRRALMRGLLAGSALAVAAAAWFAPGVFGSDLGTLRTWTPDIAWPLVATLGTWGLAAVALVVRRPGRSPSGSARGGERHEVVQR